MPTAEIICLGNELLIGNTVNTNANFLGKRLTQLGSKVMKIITLRDDLEYASKELKILLDKEPDIVCITGGLGPTYDDIQLQCIAKAIGVDMEVNEKALNFVKSRYSEMNKARKKMAQFPVGSKMLSNRYGSAPGAVTRYGKTFIFSLPGVPKEMKGIFEEEVVKIYNKEFPSNDYLFEFGVDVRGVSESEISHISDLVSSRYPNVNFKSHPKEDSESKYLGLHTYAITSEEKIVKEALEMWLEQLSHHFEFDIGKIEPIINI